MKNTLFRIYVCLFLGQIQVDHVGDGAATSGKMKQHAFRVFRMKVPFYSLL